MQMIAAIVRLSLAIWSSTLIPSQNSESSMVAWNKLKDKHILSTSIWDWRLGTSYSSPQPGTPEISFCTLYTKANPTRNFLHTLNFELAQPPRNTQDLIMQLLVWNGVGPIHLWGHHLHSCPGAASTHSLQIPRAHSHEYETCKITERHQI